MSFRFLLGLGLGAELPVAHAMLPEFLPKNARGRYVAVMEGLLPVGYYYRWNYRVFCPSVSRLALGFCRGIITCFMAIFHPA